MSVAARALEPAVGDRASGPQALVESARHPRAARHATLDLVTSRSAFRALEAEWNDLFDRAGTCRHLFQTFNWLWHWTNHFLPQDGASGVELAIVTAREGDRLVMIWPLVAERAGPLTELAWMGEPVSQYGDLLIEERADALALMREALDFVIRRTGADVLRLRKVRADSAAQRVLEDVGATVSSELKAPYLDLASAPSFEAYEKRYSSNARRNRKRQRRRLEDRGAVALTWLESGAEAATLAAHAFHLKHIWLRQRGLISPALADPRTARFFADVTRAETRPAGCHVYALSCNAQPVALEIGVRCRGRSAIHIIAYDPEFEKTATGALLMEDSIRRAYADGMTVYDMLAPGDGYKLEWADDAVVVRDWAKPLSLAGRLYVTIYLGVIRGASKRALDSLPIGVRRWLTGLLSRRAAHKA